jgi:alkanesulfonate monooxygenase SsuD/methylene tetrahydromethanopterin reductase-like flavin-dependent oxidoreductase (luciferase family)
VRRIFSPEKNVGYKGKFITFPESEFYPNPNTCQYGLLEACIPSPHERVAKYGDGWFPNGSPEAYLRAMPDLDNCMRKHNRSVGELDMLTACVSTTFANPKSNTLTVPSGRILMFPGLGHGG